MGGLPSRWRHGGLGAEPLALENFAFFCKNNLTYGCFDKKIILLKRGLEIGSANMIKTWLHKLAIWEVANGKILVPLFRCW